MYIGRSQCGEVAVALLPLDVLLEDALVSGVAMILFVLRTSSLQLSARGAQVTKSRVHAPVPRPHKEIDLER